MAHIGVPLHEHATHLPAFNVRAWRNSIAGDASKYSMNFAKAF